jgi:hypothetical protein
MALVAAQMPSMSWNDSLCNGQWREERNQRDGQ